MAITLIGPNLEGMCSTTPGDCCTEGGYDCNCEPTCPSVGFEYKCGSGSCSCPPCGLLNPDDDLHYMKRTRTYNWNIVPDECTPPSGCISISGFYRERHDIPGSWPSSPYADETVDEYSLNEDCTCTFVGTSSTTQTFSLSAYITRYFTLSPPGCVTPFGPGLPDELSCFREDVESDGFTDSFEEAWSAPKDCQEEALNEAESELAGAAWNSGVLPACASICVDEGGQIVSASVSRCETRFVIDETSGNSGYVTIQWKIRNYADDSVITSGTISHTYDPMSPSGSPVYKTGPPIEPPWPTAPGDGECASLCYYLTYDIICEP